MELERHGLVESCDDPRLLNFPLWPRQRDLLSGVEDGPRLQIWALGRRSGKTTVSALVGLWDCLLRPDLGGLVRPGERRYSVCVATNARQARLFVAAARSVVERSPLLARHVESATEDEILFRNGTALSAFPCTSRGARGWPISSLLLDEAAHMIDTEGNAAAEQVYRALIPSTAQFGDAARVIVASTPFGTDGLFAELFAKAEAGELEDATAVQATSAETNPTLDSAFLSREHARDPESFRGEYLAQFIGSGGSYIDSTRLAECVSDRAELHRLDAVGWIAGLDPGFASDPFGLVIVGRDSARPSQVRLALARSWRPTRGMTFEERRHVEDSVLDEVAEVCAAYDVTRAVTDQHLAPAIVSHLARRGVHVETIPMTATTKDLVYAELRQRINDASVELYPQPDLLAELRRLRTRYQAGRSSVVNPRVGGSHGDLAQALAVGLWELRGAADLHGAFGFDPYIDRDTFANFGVPLAENPSRGFL